MSATDRSAAGRSNRRRGHDFERDAVRYLRDHGYPAADRQLHGKSGDIEGIGDLAIECKNIQGWGMILAARDQAWADAARRGLDRGIVWKKKLGSSDVGEGYWVGSIWRELAFNRRAEELERMALAEDWQQDFPDELAALRELGRRHPGELADIMAARPTAAAGAEKR